MMVELPSVNHKCSIEIRNVLIGFTDHGTWFRQHRITTANSRLLCRSQFPATRLEASRPSLNTFVCSSSVQGEPVCPSSIDAFPFHYWSTCSPIAYICLEKGTDIAILRVVQLDPIDRHCPAEGTAERFEEYYSSDSQTQTDVRPPMFIWGIINWRYFTTEPGRKHIRPPLLLFLRSAQFCLSL